MKIQIFALMILGITTSIFANASDSCFTSQGTESIIKDNPNAEPGQFNRQFLQLDTESGVVGELLDEVGLLPLNNVELTETDYAQVMKVWRKDGKRLLNGKKSHIYSIICHKASK